MLPERNKSNAAQRLFEALYPMSVPIEQIMDLLLIRKRKNSTRPEFYVPYNLELYKTIVTNFSSLTGPEARKVIRSDDAHGAVQSLKDFLIRENLPFIVAYTKAPKCPFRYFLVEFPEGTILPEVAVDLVKSRLMDFY